MDERHTQALLEELDSVRDELSELRRTHSDNHCIESTARRLLPVVFALVAGLVTWYAVRVLMADQSIAATTEPRQILRVPASMTDGPE